jgi:hypothetical protein
LKESCGRRGDEIMVSEKQLVANRENGKKGGVRTDGGKAIVRMNALKHGLLCAQDIVLFNEDENALNQLREELWFALKPEGGLENMLFDTIVSSCWRLGRVAMLETCCIQFEVGFSRNKFHVEDYSKVVQKLFGKEKAMANLHRYEAAIERKLYIALHDLQRVQMAREGASPPAPIAIDVDVSDHT